MLNRLKLTVISIFVIALAVSLNAKQIPISEEMEITIPLGKFSVVEFPFKITSRNITSFMVAKKIDKSGKEVDKQTTKNDKLLGTNTISRMNKKIKRKHKRKSKYISIVQNVNGFTFFTKREGVIKMVIWGYKVPILLTIKVSKQNGYGFYQFILPQSDSRQVIKTEQGPHEKIIDKLMVNLFNQTLPRGYRTDSKDIVYKSKGFQMRLNREIIGRRYLGQEWILTKLNNNAQENGVSVIHEESFYQKGVYGVSLEANKIKKGESIRVFIVRSLSIPKEN